MISDEREKQPAVEVSGGATPDEAAAIVAAIQQALADDEKRRSKRPPRPKLPAWITVMRPQHPGRPESD